MSVRRAALIDRIHSLSDEEIERVGPYLHADLDAVIDLDTLEKEMALGRESAQNDPLLDDEEVDRRVRDRLGVADR